MSSKLRGLFIHVGQLTVFVTSTKENSFCFIGHAIIIVDSFIAKWFFVCCMQFIDIHVLPRRAPAIYVNIFSGEATTQFPSATQMARGGVSFIHF